MNRSHRFSFVTALGLLLGLSFPTFATAQRQIVCLSVHAGPATGHDNLNAPSTLAAQVHVNGAADTTAVAPGAGQTAAQVSAAHEAAFAAKGYTTVRNNATEFCISAGPLGAPITEGVAYGSDDTGLDIDSRVRKVPPPAGVPVVPGKPGGGGIGGPPPGQPPMPLPQPVQIIIIIEVEAANGAVTVIQVVIVIAPGMNGQQILQLIGQALRQAGLLPNPARWPSVLQPNQWVDGFQIDRTLTGATVQHIEYRYDALARLVVPQEMTAGYLPTFGASDYGLAAQGSSPMLPWARALGTPSIGGHFDIVYDLGLPNALGGELLALLRPQLAPPVFGGYVLVDPGTAVVTLGMTDAFGTLRRSYAVPNVPALSGLPLHGQGLALDANSGQPSLTNGLRAVLGQ